MAAAVLLVAGGFFLPHYAAWAMPNGAPNGNAFGRSGGNGEAPGVGAGSNSKAHDASAGTNAFGLASQPLWKIDPSFWDTGWSGPNVIGLANASGQAGGHAADLAGLDPEILALIEEVGGNPHYVGDDFPNLGQRVRTMVSIAKYLGYNAHVGALQGVFGTPVENGLDVIQQQLADLEAALLTAQNDLQAAIDARDAIQGELDDANASFAPEADILVLEADLGVANSAVDQTLIAAGQLQGLVDLTQAELGAAVAYVKPGSGPFPWNGIEWELVDLDANDDGKVDALDLEPL